MITTEDAEDAKECLEKNENADPSTRRKSDGSLGMISDLLNEILRVLGVLCGCGLIFSREKKARDESRAMHSRPRLCHKFLFYLPPPKPADSICSRAESAVEPMPCTLSLKSSGLLAFSSAVS
jgi:hypothetical protein